MQLIWRFGIIIGKTVVHFVQFFLTFRRWLIKIDSVWCTLRQYWVSRRFMITGVMPGYAFCASWRFVYDCREVGCHCEPVTDVTGVAIRIFCDATHRVV